MLFLRSFGRRLGFLIPVLLVLASGLWSQGQFLETSKSVGIFMFTFEVADVDGDADLDLIGNAKNPGRVPLRVLLNDGYGSFAEAPKARVPTTSSFFSSGLAVGDVDGDGDSDVILMQRVLLPSGKSERVLLLNDGTGRFKEAPLGHMPSTATFGASGTLLIDVDGDADLDLIFASYKMYVYINDGKGKFTDDSAKRIGNVRGCYSVSGGDLDGDGDTDLILGYWASQKPPFPNPIFLNDGKGGFKYSGRFLPYYGTVAQIQLVDFDSDGDLDAFLTAPGQDQLYLNDGKAVFTNATKKIPVPQKYFGSRASAVGDLDGSGTPDLLVMTNGLAPYPDQANALLSDGKGGFRLVEGMLPRIPQVGHGDLKIVDLDGDGDRDVASQLSALPFPKVPATMRIYSNLLRQVRSTGSPKIGKTYTLSLDSTQESLWILPYVALGTLRIPVPGIGTFGLDPRSTVALGAYYLPPRQTYRVSLPLKIPQDTRLRGLKLSSQAAYFDPFRRRFTGLSNVLTETVN